MSIKKAISLTMASLISLTIPFGTVIVPVSAATTGVTVNSTNFPDANFRKYVAEEIDDGNGVLDKDELECQDIDCSERGIRSLKGIEFFTELLSLSCSDNAIGELDLSKNKKLEMLYCPNNSITSLNIKKCRKLVYLTCNNNPASKLDISECPMLVMSYRNGDKYSEDNWISYGFGNCDWAISWYTIDKDDTTITNTSTYTGWVKCEGDFDTFRYYYKSGKIVTGWKTISKKKYYFNKKMGNAATYLTKIGKKYYLFSSSGVLKSKGWQKSDGKYYYLKKDGSVTKGWKKVKGKWYWFSKTGKMASNCKKKIGKKTYKFNKNGVCLNP